MDLEGFVEFQHEGCGDRAKQPCYSFNGYWPHLLGLSFRIAVQSGLGCGYENLEGVNPHHIGCHRHDRYDSTA